MTRMNLMGMISTAGVWQSAWRLKSSRIEDLASLDFYVEMARSAEEAKLDGLLHADIPAMLPQYYIGLPGIPFEPVSLLSAIAARTSAIGLIATLSTTFNEPYNVARQLSSLDHVSDGRAAWNIVTSFGGSENFGGNPTTLADRYARAREFVSVVTGLWSGWKPGAIVANREKNVFADPSLVQPLNHHGKIFSVAGPLNIWPSRQGSPVLVQAGQSGEGRDFAASCAEVVFAMGVEQEPAIEFRRDLQTRMRAFGRDPSSLRVILGISPILGETEAKAHEHLAELRGCLDMESGRHRLEERLNGIDLSAVDLDSPIPEDLLPDAKDVHTTRSRFEAFKALAVDEKLTLRELIIREVSATGHWSPIGTPEQVADLMIERFEAGACDGFMLMPSSAPEGWDMFMSGVVPVLQKKGYFRTEYAGNTFRENLLSA